MRRWLVAAALGAAACRPAPSVVVLPAPALQRTALEVDPGFRTLEGPLSMASDVTIRQTVGADGSVTILDGYELGIFKLNADGSLATNPAVLPRLPLPDSDVLTLPTGNVTAQVYPVPAGSLPPVPFRLGLRYTGQRYPTGGRPAATFMRMDDATQGSWRSVYGAQGAMIAGEPSPALPYATVTTDASSWVWASSTADVRAAQRVTAADRVASCWFGAAQFTLDVELTDGRAHQIALYGLDFDRLSRALRVDVLDPDGAVLASQAWDRYDGGRYMVWEVSGHVRFRVVSTGAENAVLSGVFFDASTVVPTPFTTEWVTAPSQLAVTVDPARPTATLYAVTDFGGPGLLVMTSPPPKPWLGRIIQ